jgi:hypothetical protein
VHGVRLLVLGLALCVVAAACSDVGALETEITQQEAEIGALTVQVAEQAVALTTVESRLESVISSVASIEMPTDRSGDLAALSDAVIEAVSIARVAQSTAQDAESTAWDAYGFAEDVASCVNEYMDVIGRWSSNVNSSFNYYYC